MALETDTFSRLVLRVTPVVHQVPDLYLAHEYQVIGEQTTVAAPPHGLAAHHRKIVTTGEEVVDAGEERLGLHVVGIGSERRVPKGDVLRAGLEPAAASQVLHPDIADVGLRQPPGHLLGAVLRVATTPGERTDVDDVGQPGAVGQRDEVFLWKGAMTDGRDDHATGASERSVGRCRTRLVLPQSALGVGVGLLACTEPSVEITLRA